MVKICVGKYLIQILFGLQNDRRWAHFTSPASWSLAVLFGKDSNNSRGDNQ